MVGSDGEALMETLGFGKEGELTEDIALAGLKEGYFITGQS
jgi:hypothetical protein